jgi:hypothetical protein
MGKKTKSKGEEAASLDIFQEASESVVGKKRTITLTEEDVITESNIEVRYDKQTRKNFAELKEAVDNEHAERFNRLLHSLPDREFVRVYLKTLEFFKPKVVRQLGDGGEKKDTTINILIKR